MRLVRWWAMAMACALAACGGGGGGGGGDGGTAAADHVVLTATGPTGRVPNGSTVVLDVVVTNVGTAAAANVVTTFFNFDGVRFSAIDCSATGGAVCPVTSQQFSLAFFGSPAYTAPTLPPQGSLHFRVTELLYSDVSGPMQTTASATADLQSSAAADAQATVAVTTYIDQLTVSGGALDPTAAPGGMATYVMSLSNAGPDAASNVTVTNDVGPHQTLVSAACVAAGGAVCPTTSSNGATMTVPSVPVGGSLVFTMTATVAADATGLISDVFSAIDLADRFPTDNVRVATTTAAPATTGSFLTLHSDAGETLGQGAAYAYTQADALFGVEYSDNLLTISVDGNESWRGGVRLPGAATTLQAGTFSFSSPPAQTIDGSFLWFGNASGCSIDQTQLTIDSVAFAGSTLTAIDLRFDHTCAGSSAVLHGQLHWTAADTTQPPGPVNPPPASLWRAPAGSTPASGNYIYLASDVGDFIGNGQTTVLTQANAIFSVTSLLAGRVDIGVQADDNVTAMFRGVFTQTQLLPGYYAPIQTWPSSNPAVGTFSWAQGGRGCNSESGWFVIDDIRYAGTAVASIDARFEQHCDSTAAALRGQIHWAPGDTTVPPGPVNPPPADLWAPPAGATPASGNYVYLQSDPGDFVGKGGTYLLTPSSSTIAATATGADLIVTAGPDAGFGGEFVGMNSISQLQPGYYADLERFPFNNPTRGGMTVGAFSSGCNISSGWFVVDSVAYTGGTLTSIDLRFEQHCENVVPALHGKIHWTGG